jgi:hypothetical protein
MVEKHHGKSIQSCLYEATEQMSNLVYIPFALIKSTNVAHSTHLPGMDFLVFSGSLLRLPNIFIICIFHLLGIISALPPFILLPSSSLHRLK